MTTMARNLRHNHAVAVKRARKAEKEVDRLRIALERIGHRSEPEGWDNKDKIVGYLLCCEDVIRDAYKTLGLKGPA